MNKTNSPGLSNVCHWWTYQQRTSDTVIHMLSFFVEKIILLPLLGILLFWLICFNYKLTISKTKRGNRGWNRPTMRTKFFEKKGKQTFGLHYPYVLQYVQLKQWLDQNISSKHYATLSPYWWLPLKKSPACYVSKTISIGDTYIFNLLRGRHPIHGRTIKTSCFPKETQGYSRISSVSDWGRAILRQK